jgi:tRNA pseudouridine32 synthase/23S rRNA pseudouridine746 synthase
MIENYNPPEKPFLDIIYQDDDILLLNKPAGLLSVPGRDPKHRDSLQIRTRQKFPNARTVHRLDMDTSGLIINAPSADFL